MQESVNNIVKHSHASAASVVVTRGPSHVGLVIGDDGTGIRSDALEPQAGPGGFGLTGLRERALLLGGTLRIASQPGHGTVLSFEFSTARAPSTSA